MKTRLIILLFFYSAIFLQAIDINKIETYVFEMTNQERSKRRLKPYQLHGGLKKIARMHSENMVLQQFFSHTDHKGDNPQQRKNKYLPGIVGGVGENIAYNYGESEKEIARRLIKAWLNSPGHRANLLSKKYHYLGVGVARQEQYYYATQNFGDLYAELLTERPEQVAVNSEIKLEFKFVGQFPSDRLMVLLQNKNPGQKNDLKIIQFQWLAQDRFLVKTRLAQKGDYQILIAHKNSFYPDGIIIKVR